MRKTLTERNSKILLWIGVFLFVSGIVVFIYREKIGFNTEVDATKVAQFGDFIGGVVGSLWSLAGVILFYVALTEQRKDIQINRETLETQVLALNQQIEEFRLQTEELSETRKVFQEQSETLKIQRFENTFFQLLSLHHELVDKLNFNHFSYAGQQPLEKREVLSGAMSDLKIKMEYANKIKGKSSTGEVTYTEDLPKT